MASSRLDANMPTTTSIAGSTGALVISQNALRFKEDNTSSNISIQENSKSQQFEYVSSFYTADSNRTRLTGLDVPKNDFDASNKIYFNGLYENITISGSNVNLSGPSIISPAPPCRSDVINPILSSDSTIRIACICVDTINNIYITGTYTGLADPPVYNRDGTFAYNLKNLGLSITFIMKFNEFGVSSGYTIIPKNSGTLYVNIITDLNNNLYSIGSYVSTSNECIYNFSTNLAPALNYIPSSSSDNLFLIKWSSTGFVFGVSYLNNSSARTIDSYPKIAIDSSNNVYFASCFNQSTNVYNFSSIPGSFISPFLISTGNASTQVDGFIIRYNSIGVATYYTVLSDRQNMNLNTISIDLTNNYFYASGSNVANSSIAVYNFSSNNTLTQVFSILEDPTFTRMFIIKWIDTTANSWSILYNDSNTAGIFCTNDLIGNLYLSVFYGAAATKVYNFTNTNTLGSDVFTLPAQSSSSFPGIIKWNSSGTATAITVLNVVRNYSITTDNYNNLYAVGWASATTLSVYNFYSGASAAFSSGWVSPFTIRNSDLNPTIIKWGSNGTALCYTSLEPCQGNSLFITKDSLSNIHIIARISTSGTTSVSDFYTTSTRPVSRFSIAQTKLNNLLYIKWLSNGQVDLGTYTQPFYINLPIPTSSSLYRKKLYLNTQGYTYYINFLQNQTTTSNISGSGSIKISNLSEVDLLWTNGAWTLIEKIQNATNQVKNSSQITSGPSMNLSSGVSLVYTGGMLNSTNPVASTYSRSVEFGKTPPTGTGTITIVSEGTYKISSQVYYNTPVAASSVLFTLVSPGAPLLFREVSASTSLTLISGCYMARFSYGQTIAVEIQSTDSTTNISSSGSRLNIMKISV